MSQLSTFAPQVTPPPGTVVVTLTGNTGGPVGPDGAGNINVISDTSQGSALINGNPATHTLMLDFTDVDQNIVLGTTAFESTRTVSTAVANTGFGWHAFNSVTTGADNTAIGHGAGSGITTGGSNTLLGVSAATSITSGSSNIVVSNGTGAGSAYTTESNNILVGSNGVASDANTLRIGIYGSGTGQMNKSFIAATYSNYGTENTFVGEQAGNTTLTTATSKFNVGVGWQSLMGLTSGHDNAVVGNASGTSISSGNQNAGVGSGTFLSLTSGASNSALGYLSGQNYTTESNNITISNQGTVADSGFIRIGTNGTHVKTFVAGIDGVNVGSVATVVTESGDQLGTAVITAGSGISVTPGANTITIAATGGTGTVTSISAGTGITLTPNPITTTGTVALTVPVAIANGGTNATSFATTDGTVYYDGTRLVTTATGTSGQVLTSNGTGVAPTYQTASGGITTIAGNSGSATGSTVSIVTANSTAKFVAASATSTLDFGITNLVLGSALPSLTSGTKNVGLGNGVLASTTTGVSNTVVGDGAGASLNASNCSAFGALAMATANNSNNSAFGFSALKVASGATNSCFGANAGVAISSGNQNCLFGERCGNTVTTGASNSAFGQLALSGTAITGTFNTCVGNSSGSGINGADSGNIYIGCTAGGGENNVTRIGNVTSGNTQTACFIEGIFGATVSAGSGTAVLIDSTGLLGTVLSTREVKENIIDLGSYSENIFKLRPVAFNYKNDVSKLKCSGLIAEEVEEVMPQLVVKKDNGEIMTVKYHDLSVLLLNELQKAMKRIELLESKIQS